MIISDKQELRRCVKQLVRRAEVCEASLSFDVNQGDLGVEPMLNLWTYPSGTAGETMRRACASETPFSSDAIAMFAALDAMDLPVQDLDRADRMQREYDRDAYLREILDTLRAKCVLIRVPYSRSMDAVFEDDRLSPLLVAEKQLFVPGRYGIDYAQAAERLLDAARACGARNIAADCFDADSMRYCLMPLCEDNGFALHVSLGNRDEIDRFVLMLDEFPGLRVLANASAEDEAHLIEAAVQHPRMLVRLSILSNIPQALSMLGTRFVPYSACAVQPEQMLGRWLGAKEIIWQSLAEAYLPLARSGYELQSAAIERDVRRLLSGNLLALCMPDAL